jgi:hypothetical protein
MADQVKNAAGSAGNSWDKMSEDQKKQTFDSLPQEKKQGKSYMEWVKEGYHNQYENWMPWIEDQYLKWFTNDNKTSYAAKGKLHCDETWGMTELMSYLLVVRKLISITNRHSRQDQGHWRRARRQGPRRRQQPRRWPVRQRRRSPGRRRHFLQGGHEPCRARRQGRLRKFIVETCAPQHHRMLIFFNRAPTAVLLATLQAQPEAASPVASRALAATLAASWAATRRARPRSKSIVNESMRN